MALSIKEGPVKCAIVCDNSWVIITVLPVSPTTAALKCGRQPSRNKTQSLPGQFLASLRYHRVSIESGSKAWMHFLIFFHSAPSVYLSVLLSQSLTDNLATSKRIRVQWLVILLRLTEMERVATRIVGASPNSKIPHVKLAEKKKKHIFVWS